MALRPYQAVVIVERIPVTATLDARELYNCHHARLFRFGVAFSGSEARAAEAVQEAFLDLLRNPGLVDPRRGSALALLFGMVRNRLRQSRRQEREEPLDEEGPAEEVLLLHLERAERVAAVREAILGLPEHYREVVLLCEIEECSYEEASEALSVAVGTVRSRLSRARAQLRLRLKEFEGGGR